MNLITVVVIWFTYWKFHSPKFSLSSKNLHVKETSCLPNRKISVSSSRLKDDTQTGKPSISDKTRLQVSDDPIFYLQVFIGDIFSYLYQYFRCLTIVSCLLPRRYPQFFSPFLWMLLGTYGVLVISIRSVSLHYTSPGLYTVSCSLRYIHVYLTSEVYPYTYHSLRPFGLPQDWYFPTHSRPHFSNLKSEIYHLVWTI